MKSLICSLFAAAAFASPAFAHPPEEHDDYVAPPAVARPVFTAAGAQTKAKAVLGTLIERKVVGASWRAVGPAAASVREKAGAKEWVVTFRNPKERARAKRTLYVFLTETGEYKAANHTGV